MNKTKVEKTGDLDTCSGCLEHPVGVHCWRRVSYRGVVGFVGCHENFRNEEAILRHRRKRGCRSPENCDLRFDGLYWELKGKDDDGQSN